MARESFEDEATARLMNEHFVNVKVDREERPDVDAVYMEALQAMTGQGGWPLTVFATPEGHPFYAGTYFPREQFQRLLRAIARLWREDRPALLQQGARVAQALRERDEPPSGPLPTEETLEQAVRTLAGGFDERHGGFGGAPKFPPSMVLEFLLRRGSPQALAMAERTLEAMARGGIYDQLGGGFARYSVDEAWVVPHFEKMLYDNALLLRVYAHWWRATGAPLARRVALETAGWLLREMRTPEGGFASALDADSAGPDGVHGEGLFYVWTPAQLREVLGEEDGRWAAGVFGVTEAGTFEHGTSVLRLPADPDDDERFQRVRTELWRARERRPRPERDDKVVASWNGLAIAALAEAGALFRRPDLIEAARGAAALLDEVHVTGGNPVRLARASRDGRPSTAAGMLEDYANVAEGLLTLYGVTGETRWFHRAGDLLETVLTRFPDGSGGFYDAPDDGDRLFQRPRSPVDEATPAGRFAAAGALLSYAALTGSRRHREAAEGALGVVTRLAGRFARFAGWGLAVAEAALHGPAEVAIVGPRDDPRTQALHRAALMSGSPGMVIALGTGDAADVPLLEGRGMIDGRPAAYVCRGFTCLAPVTDPRELRAQLAR